MQRPQALIAAIGLMCRQAVASETLAEPGETHG
jgi:hypothetical protein